jgi:hypothetical protein
VLLAGQLLADDDAAERWRWKAPRGEEDPRRPAPRRLDVLGAAIEESRKASTWTSPASSSPASI